MNQDFPADEVLIKTRDGLGVITLNRPEALNALSIDMIRTIAVCLHRWQDDDGVKGVLFQGAGDRAFCAGGDIRAFYNAGMDSRRGLVSPRVPVVFFAEEYSLNKQIFEYPKPTIALMNGITMGGGFGIAGHCDIRLATPETVFAMPEVGIGFFPDVGSVYHLHKAPHYFGRYLALSGQSIDARTCVTAGLADALVADEDVIIDAAVSAVQSVDCKGALLSVLDLIACEGLENADVIAQCFSDFDIQNIMQRLADDGSKLAMKTLDILRGRSPTSLMVTARHLEDSEGQSFEDVISTDFVLVQHFIRHHDLYEGIRAQLIDKDKTPLWDPAALGEVSAGDVNTYFTPTGYDLKDVQIF